MHVSFFYTPAARVSMTVLSVPIAFLTLAAGQIEIMCAACSGSPMGVRVHQTLGGN